MSEHEQIVAMLVDAFQPPRWSERSTAVYVHALEDLDPAALLVAAEDMIRTTRFMPRVAELREAVLDVVDGDVPDPAAAWAEVIAAIGTCGRHGHPRWSHPLIGRAVDAHGWRNLCDSTNPAIGTQFMHTVERFTGRARREALAADGLALIAGGLGLGRGAVLELGRDDEDDPA